MGVTALTHETKPRGTASYSDGVGDDASGRLSRPVKECVKACPVERREIIDATVRVIPIGNEDIAGIRIDGQTSRREIISSKLGLEERCTVDGFQICVQHKQTRRSIRIGKINLSEIPACGIVVDSDTASCTCIGKAEESTDLTYWIALYLDAPVINTLRQLVFAYADGVLAHLDLIGLKRDYFSGCLLFQDEARAFCLAS